MTVIEFSNGNTLNICSMLSGPLSKSARMPSELVTANSASTPWVSCIERATMLPSWLSPPDWSERSTFSPPALTYANTPLRSISWLIFTEYGHIRFAMSGSSGTHGTPPQVLLSTGMLSKLNDVIRLRLSGSALLVPTRTTTSSLPTNLANAPECTRIVLWPLSSLGMSFGGSVTMWRWPPRMRSTPDNTSFENAWFGSLTCDAVRFSSSSRPRWLTTTIRSETGRRIRTHCDRATSSSSGRKPSELPPS